MELRFRDVSGLTGVVLQPAARSAVSIVDRKVILRLWRMILGFVSEFA